MISKKQTIERIEHTIETLKSVDPKYFDLSYWSEDRNNENHCGTFMCACGFEASTEYANKRGFYLYQGEDESFGTCELRSVNGRHDFFLTAWNAVGEYFGMNRMYIEFLFSAEYYDCTSGNEAICEVIARLNYTLHLLETKNRNSKAFNVFSHDFDVDYENWVDERRES